jgi:hypothetical protein
MLPVDVVQGQACDFSCAQAVRDEQNEDGVIAPPDGGAPVHGREHALDLVPADRARQRGQPVPLRQFNRAGEILLNNALAMAVAQEDAHGPTKVRAARRGQAGRAVDHEGGQQRG